MYWEINNKLNHIIHGKKSHTNRCDSPITPPTFQLQTVTMTLVPQSQELTDTYNQKQEININNSILLLSANQQNDQYWKKKEYLHAIPKEKLSPSMLEYVIATSHTIDFENTLRMREENNKRNHRNTLAVHQLKHTSWHPMSSLHNTTTVPKTIY